MMLNVIAMLNTGAQPCASAMPAAIGTSNAAGALRGIQHAGVGGGELRAERIALSRGKEAEDLAVDAEIQRRHQHKHHRIGPGLAQHVERARHR